MIIVPDVHGRSFWRAPVLRYLGKMPVIFLGDYLDPYPFEGISSEMAFMMLKEIVCLKKEHPTDITLLLGNHDLHYLDDRLIGSRRDERQKECYREFFSENASLFQMAKIEVLGKKKILFSHAGLDWGWVVNHPGTFDGKNVREVAEQLNEMWRNKEEWDMLFNVLADLSNNRGGRSSHGSPVWADVEDHDLHPSIEGIFQVFGHTQNLFPVITSHYACLDCRKAFLLDENAKLNSL